jgi:hypothetical protein
MQNVTNPFYAARFAPRAAVSQTKQQHRRAAPRPQPNRQPVYARLPLAPINASPVPELTSLYHNSLAGEYGDRGYPGNCGSNLIKDLLRFFKASSVLDPMTGSGTCRDVCKELGIYCRSSDLHQGADACAPSQFKDAFAFCWLHPPYWRMKRYSDDPRDLSTAPTLQAFLERYEQLLASCTQSVMPGGKIAVLIGEPGNDRDEGYVPLVFHTKRLAFQLGLRQCCTDIIRFSHQASSSRKVYGSSFIPILHDVCMVFAKPN